MRVLQDLAEIERRLGIVRGRAGACRFDQNQIHEVLLGKLTPDLRAEYHTLLAEAYADREGYEGEDIGGDPFGLAEAYLEFHPSLSYSTSLRFRAGLLFPGTSRENVGPLWASPYTITLSALNTWTAEETKLVGLETRLGIATGDFSELELAGTAFGFGDPSGSLVSWRGWSMGDRLSVVGEVLPRVA